MIRALLNDAFNRGFLCGVLVMLVGSLVAWLWSVPRHLDAFYRNGLRDGYKNLLEEIRLGRWDGLIPGESLSVVERSGK